MQALITQPFSLLQSLPPEWPIDLMPSIRAELAGSPRKIVIFDDDPTGTQTSRDLPVLTHWSEEALCAELGGPYKAFFILTNSRSLPQPAACRLVREIGGNLRKASETTGVQCLLISRSDSTLRGHFPAEVDALAESMGKKDRPYLIVPFFLEGGRYTVHDIHYVHEHEQLVPAALTPFAKDAAFGFRHSNLKEWVTEKTDGRIDANAVTSITIENIRNGGPHRVAEILSAVRESQACIVNAACYRDMEVLVAALLMVEKKGKEFLYRTAASFVRTRVGLEPQAKLLSSQELKSSNHCGGLFLIGSYVLKSSLQLEALLTNTEISPIEVKVAALLDPHTRDFEIQLAADEASVALLAGRDTVLYTSRTLVSADTAAKSLAIGRIVSDSLIGIIRAIKVQPRYLVAKGGITSSDIATKGLGVQRAMILGQALPGVPVWQLGPESRYPGMPYIIFPGNVGDDNALILLQKRLQDATHTL